MLFSCADYLIIFFQNYKNVSLDPDKAYRLSFSMITLLFCFSIQTLDFQASIVLTCLIINILFCNLEIILLLGKMKVCFEMTYNNIVSGQFLFVYKYVYFIHIVFIIHIKGSHVRISKQRCTSVLEHCYLS